MREEVTVGTSTQFTYEMCVEDKINGLITELNSNNSKGLRDLLVSYHYAEAGQVNNPIVRERSIQFKSDLVGCFITEYETHYFMACSDNNYTGRNKMVIEFIIYPIEEMLKLFGEEIHERLPDAY